MLEIGADRIMFSTDWPFENIDHAALWFDACPISENDRVKIGRENARRLFRLGNKAGRVSLSVMYVHTAQATDLAAWLYLSSGRSGTDRVATRWHH